MVVTFINENDVAPSCCWGYQNFDREEGGGGGFSIIKVSWKELSAPLKTSAIQIYYISQGRFDFLRRKIN